MNGRMRIGIFVIIALFVGSTVLSLPLLGVNAAIFGTRNGDDEAPTIVNDTTPEHTDTGGLLTFSGNFTDNVGVSAVSVNYTFSLGRHINVSMDNSLVDLWEYSIIVNESAVQIDYFFFINDTSNNTNSTPVNSIRVNDIIPPVADAGVNFTVAQYEEISLDGSGSSDNIGIFNYTWVWWCQPCKKWKYRYGSSPSLWGEPSDFNVTLNVTDAAGNWDADRVYITVSDGQAPYAQANDDIVIRQHETAHFNGNLSFDNVGIANWTWSFNDNGTYVMLYGERANYTFHTSGRFAVILMVRDVAGNSGPLSFDDFHVTVRDTTPPGAIAGDDIVVNQFEAAWFNGTNSTDNVGTVDYVWNFFYLGSIRILMGPTVAYIFAEAGTYVVTLTVADEEGNADTDTLTVTVRDITPPNAKPGDDREVPLGEEVLLDGSASSDNVEVVNYTWELVHDGISYALYGIEVRFTFHALDKVLVTLHARDAAGQVGTGYCMIFVIDGIPPVADAGPDIVVELGAVVYLDGSSSTDHSNIVYYNWSFEYGGRMTSLSGDNVSFKFDLVGTYTVYLFVEDEQGNRGWDTVVVTVADDVPPEARAGSDIALEAGKTAVFNGSGTDNIGIKSYRWSFVYDGSPRTLHGSVATFVFDRPGNYLVNLTVVDEAGNEAADFLWVNVTSSDRPDDSDPVDDDGGNGPDESGSSGRINVIIIVGIFVLVVIIVILLMRKGGPGEDERKERKEGGEENDGKDIERDGEGGSATSDDIRDDEADEKEDSTEAEEQVRSGKGRTKGKGGKSNRKNVNDGDDENGENGKADTEGRADEKRSDGRMKTARRSRKSKRKRKGRRGSRKRK